MSNGTSRFSFPGFSAREDYDQANHAVVVGTIEDGGAVYGLTLIRNKFYEELPFVLASVADKDDKTIWTFKSVKDEGFDGVGLLAKAGEDVVIALCGRGKSGAVERVIPFTTLAGGKQIDLRAAIALKKAAAAFLEKRVKFSETEQKLVAIDKTRAQEAEDARLAAEAEARKAAHAERINAIRARGTITVFTLTGKKVYGVPVTEKEWPSLSDETRAVLVESIGEDGKAVGPREWFIVAKFPGRNPKRDGVIAVTVEQSQATKAAATTVKPVRTGLIETNKGVFEVSLFRSMDDIRAARSGLNGGIYVAVNGEAGSAVEVYAVHDGKMNTAGKCVLLA